MINKISIYRCFYSVIRFVLINYITKIKYKIECKYKLLNLLILCNISPFYKQDDVFEVKFTHRLPILRIIANFLFDFLHLLDFL